MKKTFLVTVLLFSNLLLADALSDKYNNALKLFKADKFNESRDLLKELASIDYENVFIYFLLGRIERKLGNSGQAIDYFNRYKSYDDINPINEVAADINLAYEYLWLKEYEEHRLVEAKKIVDDLIKKDDFIAIDPELWRDITYCYAFVYNYLGYDALINDIEREEGIAYYKKTAEFLEESLSVRNDIKPTYNNLARTYMVLINLYNKVGDKEKTKIYVEKSEEIFTRYRKKFPNSTTEENTYKKEREFKTLKKKLRL